MNENAPSDVSTESLNGLLEEIKYTEDQSPDFDKLLNSGRKVLEARQGGFSEVTKQDLIFSSWHVPCHDIIVRTLEGDCQIFHVQPNKASASLLTFEQEKVLTGYNEKYASSVVVKGTRSWFVQNDVKELERMNIKHEKTIDVDTSKWWRLVYDPSNNQIWIDIKDKKVLLKYNGFAL
jgi:hypothetical protein